MNSLLFPKMDKVFIKKKQNIKTILEKWKKGTGKVREFCKSGKMGTMYWR